MPLNTHDSLTEQIAQHLGRQIIVGSLAPDERIQELRIAAELNVSRSSVREALLILQRRHLIQIYPRRGAVVASLSQRDVADFFALWFLLLERAMHALAQRWQPSELAHLFELEAQLSECNRRSDVDGFYETSFGFLATVYAHCGNRYLEHTLSDLMPLTRRCLYLIFRAGNLQLDRAQTFISDVIKAIVARDETRISSVIARFHATYGQIVGQAVARIAPPASEP